MSSSSLFPSADELTTPILDRATIRMLLGIFGPTGSRSRNQILSFLRLTDKAIHEYKVGRAHLLEFAENQSPGLAAIFRAQGHFENCVQSLHRALLFLDGVRRLGIKSNGTEVLPDLKSLSLLSADARRRINDMRDAIEHMDDRIRSEDFPAGRHAGLHASRVDLQLEGEKISYVELYSWLRQLHDIASALLEGPDILVGKR